MPYDGFHKAEDDIKDGKLGIARDRLHGLVLSYPLDLALRSRLGDVYSMLGYPVEAGRFWFLDSELSSEKQEAVDLFIKSCGNDPSVILRRLKLRFQPDQVSEEVARERIQNQIDECHRRSLTVPDMPRIRPPEVLRDRFMTFGCVIVLTVLVLLVIVGASTVIGYFAARGK